MKRDLKALIQDTSLQLFTERDFDQVTVLDICAACDITKPTFYKFASSKGDLLTICYRNGMSAIDENWMDPLIQGSWWNCLKKMISGAAGILSGYGQGLTAHLFIHNMDAQEREFSFPEEYTDQLEFVIEQAQKHGEILNTSQPRILAETLFHLLIGYVGCWTLGQGRDDILEEILEMLSHICRADLEYQ